MPSVKVGEIKNEVSAFLDALFPADIEGFVYTPTLDRKNDTWTTRYFKWPVEKDKIVEYVAAHTNEQEVYIGPALCKKPASRPIKDNILGTKVVWAEFDGKTPAYGDIPLPDFWIQSSSEQNLHVYWTLDEFTTDLSKVEGINRALAINLGADASGWDITQILRYPLTVNHKRKKFTSEIFRNPGYVALTLTDFNELPAPSHTLSYETFDFENIPRDTNILAWDKILGPLGRELFFKAQVEHGERSTALMALAYYMAERNEPPFTDHEMFAILLQADEKWGKFKGRADRNRRLLDIVVKAREKYPQRLRGLSLDTRILPMSIQEMLLSLTGPVDWAIKDLLERSGLLFLAGPPGSGKTQISMQMAMHMAIGNTNFCGWVFDEPQKVVFMSMEMGPRELSVFWDSMRLGFDEDQLERLEEYFRLVPLGRGLHLDTREDQRRIEAMILEEQPVGIFYDSLGVATTDELSSESTIKKAFEFVNWTRQEYDCFAWFIHHTRKAQINNKRPDKLSDLYGSQYIAAHASAVVGVYEEANGDIAITSLKTRLASKFGKFIIERNNATLGFKVSAPGAGLMNSMENNKPLEAKKEQEEDDGAAG